MLLRRRVVAATFVLGACSGDAPPREPAPGTDSLASPSVQLVDPAIAPAVAGQAGWNYQLSAEADLTGDGQAERVVLTARVELYRGRPAWDDGQPWQVYVETADGRRSYVYAQRLQLGTLTMRVSRSDSGQHAAVVLLEQLPDRMSVYEASYFGPDSTSVVVKYRRDLDPRGETASQHLR